MTAVRLRGIVKRFGAVTANDSVDLAVAAGEIVALVGENGAGKSTLMNILYGLIAPDAGEIEVGGEAVRLGSPHHAIRAGLGMVHQHFMLFPSLSVAENVVFGAEPRRRGLLDRTAAGSQVAALAARYGLDVDPAARVAELPVGVRQRVEILKLLYRAARVLILDEPTAVLTPQERDALFEVLRRLAGQGHAIVLITHKLDEVMALSDRAVVMRDGRVVADLLTRDTSPAQIATAMVGRDAAVEAGARPGRAGDDLLRIHDLHARGRGAEAVRGVSLTVRAGEIVGIAGVAGNGQSALVEALMGLRAIAAGRVIVAGEDVTGRDVAARRAAGLAYVPEDRHRAGLAVDASVADDLIMGHHRQHVRRGLLVGPALAALCRRLIDGFAIKVAHPGQRAAALSGGNQQKIVVARELARGARVLIAEQPTRGVDIGTVAAIHADLLRHRERGNAVLLISAELSEILALADRILVMYEGRVAGEVPRAQATEAGLGLLMAGQQAARPDGQGA